MTTRRSTIIEVAENRSAVLLGLIGQLRKAKVELVRASEHSAAAGAFLIASYSHGCK